MHSPNITDENILKIRELFPGCVTEAKDEDGNLRYVVDFDQLKQELSGNIVEGPQERYHLNWPGKREALLAANAPIAKTLRLSEKESLNFESTQNLFIEGDNLEALKLLQETYLGKVKMIYIDPPYNTGNDFIYEDDFAENAEEFLKRSNQKDQDDNRLVANTDSNGRFHSDWLSMIYPRLKLARNLLTNDGAIFISIDENEVHNLRKACDEIFGENNFISQAGWQKVYSPKNQARHLSNDYEFVLIYAKDINTFQVGLLPRTEEMNKRYKNPDNDPRGDWKPGDLVAAGERSGGHYIVKNPYTGEEHDVPSGKHWAFAEATMKNMLEDNRIYFGAKNTSFPSFKQFLSEVKQGRVASSFFSYKDYGHTDGAKKEIIELFGQVGKSIFETVKPKKLIQNIIRISNMKRDDVILDFFAGSATTAQAVMQLNAEDGNNRKFILVQVPEPCKEGSEAFKAGYKNISDISKERIRLAGKKILEIKPHQEWNRDIGFRVLKIDSSNMADTFYAPSEIKQKDLISSVDNIKPGRNIPEDLLFQVLVDWGVDLTFPIRSESVLGKTVFFINEEPCDLIACFDTGITEELVKELAKHEPMRVVFRDNGFVSDAVKINVEQVFQQLSPTTEVKSI